MHSQCTVARLRPGQEAEIVSIDDQSRAAQRLMTLGLVEGARLRFVRSSFGGDPIEIRLYGTSLSLRREQAEHFHVRLIENEAPA